MKNFVSVILGLVFLSSCSLETRVQRTNKRNMKHAPYDAIIVPGYPYQTEENKILFNTRIFFAKKLYEEGVAKNIIFSGAAVKTPYAEGVVMKTFADSLGIPSDHTFSETQSRHSNENAYNATRMARQMGFKKIAVATDPYQFAYMTVLLRFFAPRTRILTFYPNEMPVYNKELPPIDSTAGFVKDFVPEN